MVDFKTVVVGASAGGVSALQTLVKGLRPETAAAVFVVMHMRDYQVSHLPQLLDTKGPFSAVLATDGEKIRPGYIYVAKPGHHLLIEGDHIGVKTGPKENRFRPSIDALFRSAAYMHRERVIGVVLSGMLSDGTSGLWTIKRFGGTTIVQDPDEAPFDSMPLSALEQVEVDYTLSVDNIGSLINRLVKANTVQDVPPAIVVERVRREIEVAASGNSFERGMMNFGEFTPFTCPECHGTLIKIVEGSLVRYRCHTGHGFTANALLAGITGSVEASLWNALRAMEEGVMLLEHMAQHFTEQGQPETAKKFHLKAKEAREKARLLQQQASASEHLSEDNLKPDHTSKPRRE